ncbi:FAD-binding protein [Hydrogenispora ethanolica]|uniref:FAD-binding protein n=1 Tax=Hydrogenispora ethanolica TaxID=1082276 RepID=UPI001052A72F|nr:FAD-binding protein [Hydrogenispora ethanolica]
MQAITQRMETDVLVVGGGAAGIRAAIAAHDAGATVLLVTAGRLGGGGSTFYPDSLPWGILSAGESENGAAEFYEEILSVAGGVADRRLVEVLARDSDARLRELFGYGLEFTSLVRNHEKPCFGGRPRGFQLNRLSQAQACLLRELFKRAIAILEGFSGVDLLLRDGVCAGMLGLDAAGQGVEIAAGAVVLATGGAESLWRYGFGDREQLGAGYAMAIRNGAALANLEFIQFIPGTLAPRPGSNFHHPTLSSLPALRNADGAEFLTDYLPPETSVAACLNCRASHGPFSYEDESRHFDLAIVRESERLGAPGAAVVYGPDFFLEPKFRLWRDYLAARGVDSRREPLWIYPHCQGFNGGIRIDETGMSGIPNLFACGETAGGPHGANRMGGNAILATQVFGKLSGEHAAKLARRSSRRSGPAGASRDWLRDFDSGHPARLAPEQVLDGIRETMHAAAGIIRSETRLRAGLDSLAGLARDYNPLEYPGPALRTALAAANALLTATAILQAMLARKESRGPHFREDFPERNDAEYGGMSLLRSRNGTELEAAIARNVS